MALMHQLGVSNAFLVKKEPIVQPMAYQCMFYVLMVHMLMKKDWVIVNHVTQAFIVRVLEWKLL